MEFWILASLVALLSAAWISYPFLKSRTVEMSSADSTISIYRDQLDEVERDRAAGLISESELEGARTEIERRALKAARTMDQGLSVSGRSLDVATVVIVGVSALTLALYQQLGSPQIGDSPLAQRQEEQLIRMADAGDITSRIQLLIREVSENPESFEDWWMLARSYSSIGDHASATDAYRNAVELAEDRPEVLSAYAESMTLANGNKVPGAARLIFQQLARDTADPRARYYVALAKAQTQNFEGALDDWAALANASAPGAPWMPLVRRDITNMARVLNRDVTQYLPDASPEEILASGGGLLPDGSGKAIASVQTASQAEPRDYKALVALAESQASSGDRQAALSTLADARAQYAGAPFILQIIADAERQLGLQSSPPTRRGPTDEDVQAAAGMTEQEREDMIAGMVSGLAARLEEQPNDPDGWVMLIRSYATLGQAEAAQTAYETARAQFADNPAALQLIIAQVGEVRR